MIKKIQKIFFVGAAFFVPLAVFAQNPGGNSFGNPGGNSAGNQGGNSVVGFTNPLQAETICDALKAFLNILLTFAVPVAVIFLVYAGFLFVWARGNPKELSRARTNLMYVVIGIALFMGAWLLGQVVANTLGALARGAGQSTNYIGQCR